MIFIRKVVAFSLPVLCLLAAPGLFSGFLCAQASHSESPDELLLMVGKSVIITSDLPLERVSVGYGDIAEASAVSPKEILVNGKAPGSTSLIVWQEGGGKLLFDVKVKPNDFLANSRLNALDRQMAKELAGQAISVSLENDSVFLRGQVKDLTSAERAVAIAGTIGKVVNLLYVTVPAPEPQILLKVRFASVDRTKAASLGFNLFSTGATNTIGAVSTKQFPAPGISVNKTTGPQVTLSDLLNVFLYRPDLNLGATIQALETKGVLEVLSEPNVLATNGKQASFLAGGEYPYPVVQGSALAGTVTIQFREFGVRLNFIPTITPRGSIRLQVAPEVSSLDYSNAVVVGGYSVPGLTSRKLNTEVELDEGQSFAIGGLLDKSVTETLTTVPFLGDIPVLGRFFQGKNTSRRNSELIVIVTPEIVRPMPAGMAPPTPSFPLSFMNSDPQSVTQTPGLAATGPAATPPARTVPIERFIDSIKNNKVLDPSLGTITGTSGGGSSGPPK